MTREQAREIRKKAKVAGGFVGYYNVRNGELKFPVTEWMDGCTRGYKVKAKENADAIMTALSTHNVKYRYRIEYKKGDGFVNCAYLVIV